MLWAYGLGVTRNGKEWTYITMHYMDSRMDLMKSDELQLMRLPASIAAYLTFKTGSSI